MKILVSLQRSGSTWVYKYMHQHNVLYHNAEMISPSEFFGPGFHNRIATLKTVDGDQKKYWKKFRKECDIDLSSIDEKINFIVDQHCSGIKYSLKIIPNQIIYHTEIFKDHIRNYDVITLTRRDMWQCCLSRLVQDVTHWQYTHDRNDGVRNILFEQLKNKIIIKNFEDKIKVTFDNLSYIKNLNSKYNLYYEDLTDDFLYDFFDLPKNMHIHNFNKFDIDYESLIENIDEVRQVYDKYV